MKNKLSVKELISEIEAFKGSLTTMYKDPQLEPKIRNLLKIIS